MWLCALFTLVGIAGEDLDAPDLIAPAGQAAGHSRTGAGQGTNRCGNGSAAAQVAVRRSGKQGYIIPMPVVVPRQSEAQRNRLLAELESLDSSEAAAAWAHRSLGAKNTLTAADAKRVEEAFRVKLASFSDLALPQADVSSPPLQSDPAPTPAVAPSRGVASPLKADAIDKSELTFPEPRRIRDKGHMKFVAQQPCLVCGRQPSDAHHLRFAQNRALSRKVSDEFTVSLCRAHHREVHRSGDEASWWKKSDIDPIGSARALWLKTHPLVPQRGKQKG